MEEISTNYEKNQPIKKIIVDESESSKEIMNSMENIAQPRDVEKDDIAIVCEKIKSIDFTIQRSSLNITPEVDKLYREAYLNILKNKIPTTNHQDEKEYFICLEKLGLKYEDLIEHKYRYDYYYYDLDGDGLPELGIRGGYTYILKYEPELNEFRVIYRGQSIYHKILGTGQIWYHDGLHADLIRDGYIVLNHDNEWEMIVRLEQGVASPKYYSVDIDGYERVDIGEENWNKITKPFFDATENAIPSMSLEEVFGELLEEN